MTRKPFIWDIVRYTEKKQKKLKWYDLYQRCCDFSVYLRYRRISNISESCETAISELYTDIVVADSDDGVSPVSEVRISYPISLSASTWLSCRRNGLPDSHCQPMIQSAKIQLPNHWQFLLRRKKGASAKDRFSAERRARINWLVGVFVLLPPVEYL
jgi:hypothetical protein